MRSRRDGGSGSHNRNDEETEGIGMTKFTAAIECDLTRLGACMGVRER